MISVNIMKHKMAIQREQPCRNKEGNIVNLTEICIFSLQTPIKLGKAVTRIVTNLVLKKTRLIFRKRAWGFRSINKGEGGADMKTPINLVYFVLNVQI